MRSLVGSKVSCARRFGLVSLTVALFVVFGAGQGWARWYTNKSLKSHKKRSSSHAARTAQSSKSGSLQLNKVSVSTPVLKADGSDSGIDYTSGSKYCKTPPFMSQASVPPNILIVMDVSISMAFPAYGPNKNYWVENSYDSSRTYYGYFKNDKFYKYSYSKEKFIENSECSRMGKNCIPGNFLNWATMSRIDILRKVLIGGKADGCSKGQCTLVAEGNDTKDKRGWKWEEKNLKCKIEMTREKPNKLILKDLDNDSKCELGTLEKAAVVKVDVPEEERRGVIQKVGDKDKDGEWDTNAPRFGLMIFSSTHVGCMKSGVKEKNLREFVNTLQKQDPTGGTPTGEALINALDYFTGQNFQYNKGCENSNYEGNAAQDPWGSTDAWCRKSYILLVSDGAWNGYDCRENCGKKRWPVDPVKPAWEGRVGIFDDKGNGVDYDLRPDRKGKQTIAIYAVYAFARGETGSNALKNVAIYGGFDDLDGDTQPYPYPKEEWNNSAYLNSPYYPPFKCFCKKEGKKCGGSWEGYCNPFGSRKIPIPPECNKSNPDRLCSEWDRDRNGVPDNYYSAQEGDELERQITKALYDILKKASSGTSATVLSERTQAGATMLQALFYPEKTFEGGVTLKWIGYLNTFWLHKGSTANSTTIREDDNNTDGCCYILDLEQDNLIHFVFDNSTSTTKIERCQDSNGDGICDSYPIKFSLDELQPIFEVGEKLQQRVQSSRKIYTNVKGSPGWIDFVAEKWDRLKPYLLTVNETETRNLINYIRGEDFSEWRNRTVNGKVWKLGDITYSTPQVVKYDDYSVIFVGANDGMLHAFELGKIKADGGNTKLCDESDAGCNVNNLGRELWAYIPANLLPYLRYLTDPKYCHLYYVDLTPFIFTYTDSLHHTPRKILIGGMRLGGACNCTGTDDECVVPPADANGTGLSSYFALDITDPANPAFLWEFTHPDLGFTYSGPAVFSIEGHPVVVFLSGPTHYNGVSTKPLKVFVLTLDPKDFSIANTYIRSIGIARAFGGRLFVNKIGINNHVYFGYTQGGPGNWKGGVYRLDLAYNATNDDVEATATPIITGIGPITAGVREGTCKYHKMIFFAEGRYFSGSQDDPTAIRRLYGVNSQYCTPCTLDMLGNATDTNSTWDSTKGWYIDLYGQSGGYNAERSITDPLVYAKKYNVVFFTTFQPTADICGFGGRTAEFMTACDTGGSLGEEKASKIEGKLFLQVSTGQIKEFTCSDLGNRRSEWVQGVPSEFPPTFITPPGGREGKLLHWLER